MRAGRERRSGWLLERKEQVKKHSLSRERPEVPDQLRKGLCEVEGARIDLSEEQQHCYFHTGSRVSAGHGEGSKQQGKPSGVR